MGCARRAQSDGEIRAVRIQETRTDYQRSGPSNRAILRRERRPVGEVKQGHRGLYGMANTRQYATLDARFVVVADA